MIYVFAGTKRIAASKALELGIPPESTNVTLITPETLDSFRGRIVYDHDQIILGDFPYGGYDLIEEAIKMAKR